MWGCLCQQNTHCNSAGAHLLTRGREVDHVTLILFHWLFVCFHAQVKVHILTYKSVYGQVPGYLKNCLLYQESAQLLESPGEDFLHSLWAVEAHVGIHENKSLLSAGAPALECPCSNFVHLSKMCEDGAVYQGF